MSITRYKAPSAMMQEMQNWLKEDLLNEDFASIQEGSWLLRVNICEYADHFIITADLPGVAKENLEISIENRTLILKGHRQYEINAGNEGEMLRNERYNGQFYRCVSLPQAINEKGITAKLEQGILTLNVPKATEQATHFITIE